MAEAVLGTMEAYSRRAKWKSIRTQNSQIELIEDITHRTKFAFNLHNAGQPDLAGWVLQRSGIWKQRGEWSWRSLLLHGSDVLDAS